MMKNIFLFEIITGVLGIGLVAWMSYGFLFESSIETPAYKVDQTYKKFEIRTYESFQVIQTVIGTNNQKPQNSGFRVLANYIFGGNQENQKIAMTAPVLNYETDQHVHMAFVLPKDLNKAPKPDTNSVQIKPLSIDTVAVITFSGFVNEQTIQDKKAQLKEYLANENIRFTDQFYVAQYNSPWVFPLFRKNEIFIEVIK